MAFDI